jgi:Flp pilus assembly protein TadD
MQPYTAAFAAINLKSQRDDIRIGKYAYRAEIGAEQGWMLERGEKGQRKLPIAHVLGGKNVFYFLTPGERGRLQTLPLAFDVRRQEWLDTARSGVRHVPERPDDEPLHWTDREYTFNTSCHSCHLSQLATNYDLATDTYSTTWTEPGINCETCHGSGAAHVEAFRNADKGKAPKDIKIISAKSFGHEQTDAMCSGCHAKMSPVSAGFVPGERFFDHYDLIALEHPDFYEDGRDLGENYTYTQWRMSPCVQSGKMDCMYCHTSSGRFRFKDEPNRACLPCHQKRVDNAAAHSKHPLGSEGNLCIRCHMPKTEFARMTRSDHSMRPPTPATTIKYKSPNACNLCHADQDAAWSNRWVREWRPRDYQAPVLQRAGLIDAARKGDWTRLDDMLSYITSGDRDEIFAAGLLRLLGGCPDKRKVPALTRALADRSPLVRAAAAQSLDGWLSPETLPPLLTATRDEFRLVRVRAAATLTGVPLEHLEQDDRDALANATAEYLSSARARPDDASAHYNLGNFYLNRRELDLATQSYATSHRLDPRAIPPLVNAATAYSLAGQNVEAESQLRRALRIDPNNVTVNLNLGMLLAELGRPADSERAFRAALKTEPDSAVAAYNLGILLAEHKPDESLRWCGKAHEIQPDEPKYAWAYAFYLRQRSRLTDAAAVLQPFVSRGTHHGDAYLLLGDIYMENGKTEKARDVYELAAGNEQLPLRLRHYCGERLEAIKSLAE